MKRVLALLFLIHVNVFCQTAVETFPDDLSFQPFAANVLEPKLGFNFQTGGNELSLNIGNSLDIFRYSFQDNSQLTFGADLFTFTLLRGEQNFHFPVDAVDYLFGFNFSYKKKAGNTGFGGRLRISHISAHFVDGHFDGTHQRWRDGRNPKVYSREFIELNPFVKFSGVRVYAGFTYIFHVDPQEIKKDNYQLGFDYFAVGILSESITPFFGYDIKLIHLDKYTANNSIVFGIKFGKPSGKGFSLFYNYYSGKSINGEYYDVNRKYSAIAINLDL